MEKLLKFLKDDKGASAVEYATPCCFDHGSYCRGCYAFRWKFKDDF